MRKLIGTLLIILIAAFGGLFILAYAAFSSGTYYGPIGYCDEVKLPGFHAVCIAGLLVCLLALLYYTYLETFLKFEQNRSSYKGLLIVLMAVLGCLAYYIFRFPFVNWSYGLISQSGKQEGLHNPLMPVATVYAASLVWMTIRFRAKACMTKKTFVTSIALLAAFLLATGIVFFRVKYEVCFG